MKVIVGLGNPGREYEMTRHNLGFMLIDRLFERAGGRRFRGEAGSKVAEVALAGQRVLLAKPQTFMNLSGEAVRPLLERYGDGNPANLIVVSDEAALPFGMLRVRARGSAGGHNGLKSIIERIGSQEFARIRLGVQPDHPVEDLVSFVLSPIPRRERGKLDETLATAADAVEVVLTEGVERAMARFNTRVKSDK
ncbi:MAG TPA: aminoacyl-tRNA hydrolase [Blastocatellia bacterium]|nr:aminoacyl-tRNA hydrolase [Blastocatellia bacterium]